MHNAAPSSKRPLASSGRAPVSACSARAWMTVVRGGDIDLLVETPDPVAQPALAAARLAVKIERRLDGRHVDVVLVTPETPALPIHDIARRHGMAL